MRIHHLQHVPFEGLGYMESVLKDKGHKLTSTHFYDNQPLPSIDDIDWLIIMGGPMGIYDDQNYPWLQKEKEFIKEAIKSGKIVLGLCLGAQLIADVLGAKVYKNEYKEIGWFDIQSSSEIKDTILDDIFPKNIEVFHWHGDTFDIPKGAKLIASSEACKNQGFILDNRVVALQFHLETTVDSANALIKHCANDLDSSKYVQSKDQILADEEKFKNINSLMLELLELLENS
jgi:GMP synthase-like glutamine amidotransferase